MNLELRNTHHSERLSEETPAYAATLYLDGKKVAEMQNDGHGGCDMVHFIDRATEKKVEDYFKSLPKHVCDFTDENGKPVELDESLEMWAHGIVWDRATIKTIKRTIARKVVGIVDGKEFHWKVKPQDLDRYRTQIVAKYPGVVFLNDLKTDAELLAAVKGAK